MTPLPTRLIAETSAQGRLRCGVEDGQVRRASLVDSRGVTSKRTLRQIEAGGDGGGDAGDKGACARSGLEAEEYVQAVEGDS
jgi:hypothetical protein